MNARSLPVFDAHLHIIDPRFPLQANAGFLPPPFTTADYLQRLRGYRLIGGAIVSGSFQGFDQSYLRDALGRLGSGFVGITQLPATATDGEIRALDAAGVRGIRFNLHRGGSAGLGDLETLAVRVHDLAGWHVELYADARELETLLPLLVRLPAVSIDHLGLSAAGLPTLRRRAAHGVHIKATGFGRVGFDVDAVLPEIHAIHPGVLMFGTDLPSTRAPRPYADTDLERIVEALGEAAARRVLAANALDFYRLPPVMADTPAPASP